jgi:hypothetical protein
MSKYCIHIAIFFVYICHVIVLQIILLMPWKRTLLQKSLSMPLFWQSNQQKPTRLVWRLGHPKSPRISHWKLLIRPQKLAWGCSTFLWLYSKHCDTLKSSLFNFHITCSDIIWSILYNFIFNQVPAVGTALLPLKIAAG